MKNDWKQILAFAVGTDGFADTEEKTLSNHPALWVMAAAIAAPLLAEIPVGFRMPVVVLEVVLGILIGPHALGPLWSFPRASRCPPGPSRSTTLDNISEDEIWTARDGPRGSMNDDQRIPRVGIGPKNWRTRR